MTTPFKVFLLCSIVLLGRPQDILPFLQPLRPALVVAVLAAGALVFGTRRQELLAALSTSEAKRYLLLYLIMIFGIPFAYHRRIAFTTVFEVYILNVIFFVFLIVQITSLQRLKALVWIIGLSTLMYSFFGGLLQTGDYKGGRFQVLGGAFDANDTAFLLVSLFPLSLYFVYFNEGLLKRLVAIATIPSAIAIILLTGSRGGIVALTAGLAILIGTRVGGIKGSHKLLVVVVLASTFALMRDRIDLDRYMTIFDVSSDYNLSAEGGRMSLWEGAIDLTLANPITGVGVGCYSWAYYLARKAVGSSYLKYHTVHNSYLEISSEIGLIGFGVFVLIALRSASTFLRTARMRPESHEVKELRALAGLMLLGFVGLSVAAFFLSQGYSILFTLFFALAAATERIKRGLSWTGAEKVPTSKASGSGQDFYITPGRT